MNLDPDLTPVVLDAPVVGGAVLKHLLMVSDLLDQHRPNLLRHFMVDLILLGPVTTDDVMDLGLQLLQEAHDIVSAPLTALTRELRHGISRLATYPTHSLSS
ncbi:hypothetical protein [Deinococcus sp. Leaf326]|uniref:hypothetical protein n=1 Tax=Deinococcus sp. Leaf326 TaxID=1736338 RepID=UPI0006F52C42|nr:hypothetical protein [Deinococcus sp. Leaf326]KQR35152.1 hypothetical protein ASF71_16355 [Deinococcus sp. Leaf326]